MVGPEPTNWRAWWLFQRRPELPAVTAAQKKRRKPPYVTQEELTDRLIADGFELDRPRYVRLEKGRNPISDDLLARLARYFKVPVPTAPEPVRTDIDRLIDALDRHTKAITDWMAEARQPKGRLEQASLDEEFGKAIGQGVVQALEARGLVADRSETPPAVPGGPMPRSGVRR